MTDEEIMVLMYLKQAHNAFVRLDKYNSNDSREWVHNLHALQHMVMARQAVRDNTELFTQPVATGRD